MARIASVAQLQAQLGNSHTYKHEHVYHHVRKATYHIDSNTLILDLSRQVCLLCYQQFALVHFPQIRYNVKNRDPIIEQK
jgi:hypothetical protein